MKKVIAILVLLTLIIGVAKPNALLADGPEKNPFKDIFPVDIPIPG